MSSGKFDFNTFVAENEPMPSYAPYSDERKTLEEKLETYDGRVEDVPIVIGEEEIRTDQVRYQVCVSNIVVFGLLLITGLITDT